MHRSAVHRWLASAGLAVGLACAWAPMPAHADSGAGTIEVIRGTEKRQIRADDRASDPRIQQQNGVEKVYGVEPGTGRIGIETRRYTLEASERAEIRRDVRELITLLERELGIRVRPGFEIDLEVLGDHRQFSRRQGGNANVAGFYRQSTGETVVSAQQSRQATRQTMLHEACHAIVGDRIQAPPAWLTEGLAEYFETLDRRGGHARIPAQPERHRIVSQRVARSELLGLADLVAGNANAFYGERDVSTRTSYDHAWSIVSFLMNQQGSRSVLREVLADLERSIPIADALETRYPGGLQELDRGWRRWLVQPARAQAY